MREGAVVARQWLGHHAIFVHKLRAKGFLTEVNVTRRDGVDRLDDLPLPCSLRT